mmetsp:Transcript_7179/g.14079  ORF Transcript_7179/g.14079 Transcript_7179/m.14079 type:complete len:349 (-) Transcript_7179:1346-2392(-)
MNSLILSSFSVFVDSSRLDGLFHLSRPFFVLLVHDLLEISREFPVHILLHVHHLLHAAHAVRHELVNHTLHNVLRCACPRRQGDPLDALQPLRLHVICAVDEVRVDPSVRCDLPQPVAVGRSVVTDNDRQIGIFNKSLEGVLSVRRCVTDGTGGDGLRLREFLQEGTQNFCAVIHRERRLGGIEDLVIGTEGELVDVLGGLQDGRLLGGLRNHSLDLNVLLVSDEDDVLSLGCRLLHVHVDLGDQRAGGVDLVQLSVCSLLTDLGGNAVGRVDHLGALRNISKVLNEDRPLLPETVTHDLVVHDLVLHIDGRSPDLDGRLNGVDRPGDTLTEPPRGCEHQLDPSLSIA